MNRYSDFIEARSQLRQGSGFEPVWMPDFLFGFQSFLTEWAIKQGRGAMFADCGIELKPSYYKQAVKNLRDVEVAQVAADMFQLSGVEV